MRDCKNLRMLSKSILMLKFLETLIISGCWGLNELSVTMMRNMESLEVLETDGIPISELWPRRSPYILSSFPCSVVYLSLKGCNLSDDAFPRDFGYLSSLKRLNLGNNPICTLPNCIKGLTRLRRLYFSKCRRLKSVLGLPKVEHLNVRDCISLEKTTCQSFSTSRGTTRLRKNDNQVEWECNFKLETTERADVEMINLLGLSNLESIAPVRVGNPYAIKTSDRSPMALYEYGMFSTFLAGNEVPGQFSHKST